MGTLRRPAVAGSFYPADPEKLKKELERCLAGGAGLQSAPIKKRSAIGVVSPHAGYIYSGEVAGALYRQLELPEKFIILSPNHTGYGVPCSLFPGGRWETPLGQVPIDTSLAAQLKENCPELKEDQEAHLMEHSLEVQIPFLQTLCKTFSFVAVTLSYLPFETCREIGLALAKTLREVREKILLIASSDMNHYEGQEVALKKDQVAIDQILKLDAEGLYREVKQNGVSMCGIIPATVMLVAARELGARRAELIQHATSGDVTGDYGSVVGYASLVIS